jgi:hypothetical protein
MITNEELAGFIQENIADFHNARLESLRGLKIDKLLKRKNPYLFKSKNAMLADELVKLILDAHLSSQEETIFGDFLEKLAVYINGRVYGGAKSCAEGIDLEFVRDGRRYIVSIKSGPNWGNSGQIAKMRSNFIKAKRILRTGGGTDEPIAINGCCYGINRRPDKGDYFKLCGQKFWELISGDSELYKRIIEPLGHNAKRRNDEFNEEYARIINTFVQGFVSRFCNNGKIDWALLVEYNSKN